MTDHDDPGFLVRYARGLIGHAREIEDERVRDAILNEAAGAISAAERLMPRPTTIILAEAV